MEDSNRLLPEPDSRTLYEWIDIIEGELYSIVYEVIIQIREVF